MASARLESLEQSRNGSLPPLRAPISLPDMTLHPQHPNQRIRILLALCFPPTADQTNQDPASHQASPPGRHRGKRPARRRTGPEPRSAAHQRSRADDRTPRAAQPSVQPPDPRWPLSRLHRSHPGALPLLGKISRSRLPQSAPTSAGVGFQSPLRLGPGALLHPLAGPSVPSDLGDRRAHPLPAPLGPLGPPSSPHSPALPTLEPSAPARRSLFRSLSGPLHSPAPSPLPRSFLSLSLPGPASRHHATDWRAAERGLPLQPPPPRLEVRSPADPPLPARKWLPSSGVRGPGIGRAHAPARGASPPGPHGACAPPAG